MIEVWEMHGRRRLSNFLPRLQITHYGMKTKFSWGHESPSPTLQTTTFEGGVHSATPVGRQRVGFLGRVSVSRAWGFQVEQDP